jgi:hypothetical protein
MDKLTRKAPNERLKLPFLVTLIGVLLMIAAMFLPYMNAQGTLSEYIKMLDRTELEVENISPTPSVLSVKDVVTTVYGESDGKITEIVVLVFGATVALTALFVLFKRPIAIMFFDLLALGGFSFLNYAMSQDFIGPDKYAWGIGYYLTLLSIGTVFTAAIWLLVRKIATKRELKARPLSEPTPATEAPTEQS